MPMINLPYGNNEFNSDDLKEYIRQTGRSYIIQGQQNRKRADHSKPHSLDCWLRDNYATNSDTKQAVNEVVAALVNTGEFEEGHFSCPDSGRRCKGIRLTPDVNSGHETSLMLQVALHKTPVHKQQAINTPVSPVYVAGCRRPLCIQ